MSPRPCDLCQQRVPGKLAALYWAWFVNGEDRVAWKQRTCLPCFKATWQPLLQSASSASTESLTCPVCGGESTDDGDAVFLTLYLPKQVEREYELNTDAACAAKVRLNIYERGERLPDRSGSTRGPSTSSTSAWDALEL